MLRQARVLPAILAALLALPGSTAFAQRWSDDVDGAETCRDIWREYGRSMSGRPYAVYCEVRDIGIAPRASTIDVDGGPRSGVKITGASRSDVRVRLVIQAQGENVADAKELASRVTMDLSRSPLRASVPRTPGGEDNPRNGRRYVATTIVIDAPVESNVSARTDYAPLDVENVKGRIDVTVAYGPLSLRDVGGDVRARVAYGPLGVQLSGQQWQGTGLDAVASHGPMTLRLPRGFGAELEIGAEHGPFESDFPLTLTRFDRSRLQTKLGAGGPRIRAIAEYGPMSLKMDR